METYVENWFDSEIAGKSQYKLAYETFMNEFVNFNKMIEAIDYCNESSVISVSINENVIIDKIKELWERFVNWVRELLDNLKAAWNLIKAGLVAAKAAMKAVRNDIYEKYKEELKKEFGDFSDAIDVEYKEVTVEPKTLAGATESTILEASDPNKKFIGIKIIPKGTVFTSTEGLIDDTKVGLALINAHDDSIKRVESLVLDIAEESDKEKRTKMLEEIEKINDENVKDNKDDKWGNVISTIYDFSNHYTDFKSYTDYLVSHLEKLSKASDAYNRSSVEITRFINEYSKYIKVAQRNESVASPEFTKATSIFIKMLRRKAQMSKIVGNACKVDSNFTSHHIKLCVKYMKKASGGSVAEASDEEYKRLARDKKEEADWKDAKKREEENDDRLERMKKAEEKK